MDTEFSIPSGDQELRYKQFLALLVEHKSSIYGYILALLPHPSLASDVMQETVMVMWEKFGQFVPGTNFLAWGKAVALNKIRSSRRDLSKLAYFDDEVLDRLASEPPKEESGRRIEALQSCLKNLSKTDTRLIRFRFTDQMKVREIAQSWGKPANQVYRRMSQIFYFLRECVNKKLAVLEGE